MNNTISRPALRRFAIVCFALASVLLVANVVMACPTCKDGLAANDPEHQGIVKGYFYSILLMMGTPYIVLGSFGFYMYRKVKKARAESSAHIRSGIQRPILPASSQTAEPDEMLAEPLEV